MARGERVVARRTGQTGSILSRPADVWRNRGLLGLLIKRDLTVRYANSALGYLWSLLDPLLMSAVYWFVFTAIFNRHVGSEPYIVFLLVALLPWTWFQNAVGDSSHALQAESRLVRSTALPRELWALRVVLSKGVEFLFSIPILAIFAFVFGARVTEYVWLFPVAMIIQVILLTGLSLLLSPLTVLLRDVDPLVKIALRFAFYVSPIIYGINDIYSMAIATWMKDLFLLNPLTGLLTAYRSAFFADSVHWPAIISAALISLGVLLAGQIVFARLERQVLKEL